MEPTLHSNRLEAFSDGVFAIAITLLVLEISLPEDAGDDLLRAFIQEWPSYLAYLVSFATIGMTWLRHATITHHLRGVDTALLRMNLLLLLLVAFLPFPTRLVAEHLHDRQAERVAATILGINLLLISIAVSWIWSHAVRQGLAVDDADDDEVRLLDQRLTPSLAAYGLLILLGLVAPLIAVLGYLGISVAVLLPFGLRRRS